MRNLFGISQENHILVGVHVKHLQLLIVGQSVQDVIFRELLSIPLRNSLDKLLDDLVLAHLLQILRRHHVAHIVDYRCQLVSVVLASEPIVLFYKNESKLKKKI